MSSLTPTDAFHPLDEIVHFGVARHGLSKHYPVHTLTVAGKDFPLTESEGEALWSSPATIQRVDLGNTHLLRVPGVKELNLDPEFLENELTEGRQWQNYALLSGRSFALFGHALNGWVCIDPVGVRWLVQPGQLHNSIIAATSGLTVELSVRPFGYLGEPHAYPDAPESAPYPLQIQATLADIGQESPFGLSPPNGSFLEIKIASISSDGRRVIIALYPSTSPRDPRDMPYGFLMLTLEGGGSDFTASLSILRTRTQVLGVREYSRDLIGDTIFTLYPEFTASDYQIQYDNLGNVVSASGTWSVTGFEKGAGEVDLAFFSEHQILLSDKVTGRIIGLIFNERDEVVELTADYELTEVVSYTEPVFSASGSVSASNNDTWAGRGGLISIWGGTISGEISIGITLTREELYEVAIVIKRGDSVVSTYKYEGSAIGEHTDHWTLGSESTGDYLETFLTRSVTYRFTNGGTSIYRPIQAKRDVANYIPSESYTRIRSIGFDGSELYRVEDSGYGGHPLLTTALVRWVELSWQPSGAPYLRFDMALQRLSNNVWAARWERYISAVQRDYAHAHIAFSVEGQLLNERTESDWLDRNGLVGSYHPITHEVHATFDWGPGNISDGVWV